mgnify:FL=1
MTSRRWADDHLAAWRAHGSALGRREDGLGDRSGHAIRRQLSLRRRREPPLQAQIQITPLIDVLLVLLIMGTLAWVSARAADRAAAAAAAASSPAPMSGSSVSLPIKPGSSGTPDAVLTAQAALIGLDAQGRLSWQGRPVTPDLLMAQVDLALAQDPQTPVWLAIDAAASYADVVRWLDWLQSRQVRQLNLLTARPAASTTPPTSASRKP